MNNNPATLFDAARRAMAAGDFATAAAELLQLLGCGQAATFRPGSISRPCAGRLNNVDGAYAGAREALRLEPRNFHALLMSATLLERAAATSKAPRRYTPRPWPMRRPINIWIRRRCRRSEHGRERASRSTRRSSTTSSARAPPTPRANARLDAPAHRCVHRHDAAHPQALSTGAERVLLPWPAAIEFYERDEFPWLAEFEAATSDIQKELVVIVREEQAGFDPTSTTTTICRSISGAS